MKSCKSCIVSCSMLVQRVMHVEKISKQRQWNKIQIRSVLKLNTILSCFRRLSTMCKNGKLFFFFICFFGQNEYMANAWRIVLNYVLWPSHYIAMKNGLSANCLLKLSMNWVTDMTKNRDRCCVVSRRMCPTVWYGLAFRFPIFSLLFLWNLFIISRWLLNTDMNLCLYSIIKIRS